MRNRYPAAQARAYCGKIAKCSDEGQVALLRKGNVIGQWVGFTAFHFSASSGRPNAMNVLQPGPRPCFVHLVHLAASPYCAFHMKP